MTSYHVSATSHWPNYLPEYIAVANGYFADEGLEFSRDAPDDWTGVLRSLADGSAQAVLGGLWVPAMYHGRGHHFVAFAQLNARNPKAIVTREPQPGFQLSDLEGKLVLAPGAGGTAPYMHTAGLIRQAGIDLSAVRFIRDLSGQTLSDLFAGGLGTRSSSTSSTPTSSNTKASARSPPARRRRRVHAQQRLLHPPAPDRRSGSAPWRFTARHPTRHGLDERPRRQRLHRPPHPVLATAPPRGPDRQRRRPRSQPSGPTSASTPTASTTG